MRVLFLAPQALLFALAWTLAAQASPACDALTRHALRLYAARDNYARVVAAARQARGCAGRAAPAELFAAEAWGLINDERWDDLVALGEAFGLRPGGTPPSLEAWARVEGGVGVALVVRGRASEGLGRQRALLARLPQTRPLLRASALSSLAWSYGLLGDHAEADRLYSAMETTVTRHLYGPARRPMRLRALSERAGNVLAWHENDLLPEAARRLALARDLAREAYGLASAEDDVASAAIARLFEGEALHYLGDLEGATAALQQVRALPDDTYWPYADWDLARVAARQGRDAEAERLYRRALEALTADPADERDALYELGALYERAGRLAEAEATYRKALLALDRLLETAGMDDSWLRVQSVWQRPYRGLSRVLVRQGRAPEAFATLEAAHARFLLLYRTRAALLDPSQQRALAGLLAAQESVRDSLGDHQSDSERLRLSARDDVLRARIVRLTPSTRVARLDVPALQQRLGAQGQALVSFMLDTPEPFLRRDLASFAFVVTADTVAAVPLPLHAAGVSALVAQTSSTLTDPEVSGVSGRAFDLKALHGLYTGLVAPTRRFWARLQRLVVIPDGPLFSIPLAALVTQPGVWPGYLSDSVATSTEVAATLLMQAPTRAATPLDVLVAGRSRFAPSEAAALPQVRREAGALRRTLGNVRILLDDQATETTVRAAAAQARVLHLATHTELRTPSPLFHALRLTPDAQEDGLLRLHEIQAQHLPLELVVLSGCATARGVLHAGEGMAGLQYGFRAAGARNVLATLWLVDDAAMAEVMGAFYRGLTRGRPPDVALMEAQRAYRHAHPRATPFEWAAPVLYGPADAIRLRAAPWHRHPAVRFGGIGAVMLAAGLGLGVALRRRRTL